MGQIMRLEDLLATAQQVEAGAADRYLEYAEAAAPVNPEISALFRRLAEEEHVHEKSVLDLAREASIDLNDGVPAVNTSSKKNVNTEHTGDTLYEILAAAVNREERAFEIYSQIAASNIDEDVRRYAEILAKEELGHAALLRAMRRRVYPEHREKTTRSKLAEASGIATPGEFLVSAYALESELSSRLHKLHADGEDMSTCLKHSDTILQQLQADMAGNPEINDRDQPAIEDAGISLQTLVREFDRAYEYYDRFVTETTDEIIMKYALYLASQTLVQLNTIHILLNRKAVA